MDLILKFFQTLAKHPIHPMVVHFPIALTGAAAFFILLALWKKNKILEQVAFADIALASVSTVAAGITGIRDNIVNFNGAAPNVGWKITLAIILLIVTALTSYFRWKDDRLFEKPSTRTWYVAAYFVSFALAFMLGYLGGIIVFG
jgi:uncharacterized membrane protein